MPDNLKHESDNTQVFGYTQPSTGNYAGYLVVNANKDGSLTLRVRNEGSAYPSSITLPTAAAKELVDAITQ